MNKKTRLGRGLDALLTNNENLQSLQEVLQNIDIELIAPNPNQPRKKFNKEELLTLTESIRIHGLLQPIIITPTKYPYTDKKYTLIAGERRLRASKQAGVKKIQAIIRDSTENKNFELAIIENVQRENLNPIEEALAFKKLGEKYHLTQEEISKQIGKSRPAIANSIRLLDLPDSIQQLIESNVISVGHARLILSIQNNEQQIEVAQIIQKKKLSVRDLEKFLLIFNKENKIAKNTVVDPDINALESEFIKIFGTSVKININKKNIGNIRINFHSIDEFEGILEKMKNSNGGKL